jgi:GrpB-like predicted nucleotidyltransferase (UPF0157 family)
MTSVLGLESGTVRLVPYDDAWPAMFDAERTRIEGALTARGVSLVIEHTGSTAVPGLAAKPVLDILAARHPRDREAYINGKTAFVLDVLGRQRA